jgi:hypothetical protein
MMRLGVVECMVLAMAMIAFFFVGHNDEEVISRPELVFTQKAMHADFKHEWGKRRVVIDDSEMLRCG